MSYDEGPDRARAVSMVPAAFVVTATWIVVAVSCVVQKRRVDDSMPSFGSDLEQSAIYLQQLNGSATSHMLAAIAIGLGVTAIAGFWAATAASRSAVAGFQVVAELRAQSSRPVAPGSSGPSPTRSIGERQGL